MDVSVSLTGVRASSQAGELLQTYALPIEGSGTIIPLASGSGGIQ